MLTVYPSMPHNEEVIKEVFKKGVRCTTVCLRTTVW